MQNHYKHFQKSPFEWYYSVQNHHHWYLYQKDNNRWFHWLRKKRLVSCLNRCFRLNYACIHALVYIEGRHSYHSYYSISFHFVELHIIYCFYTLDKDQWKKLKDFFHLCIFIWFCTVLCFVIFDSLTDSRTYCISNFKLDLHNGPHKVSHLHFEIFDSPPISPFIGS